MRLEVGKLQCQSTGNHVARTHAPGQMAALKCCAEIVNIACGQIGVDDGQSRGSRYGQCAFDRSQQVGIDQTEIGRINFGLEVQFRDVFGKVSLS